MIDISKVYDRVDWNYVTNMMRKMGFHEKCTGWMSICMGNPNYNVQENHL